MWEKKDFTSEVHRVETSLDQNLRVSLPYVTGPDLISYAQGEMQYLSLDIFLFIQSLEMKEVTVSNWSGALKEIFLFVWGALKSF